MSFFKKIFSKEKPFTDSEKYWEQRYKTGGNSGRGSFGRLAEFKAEILNSFVKDNTIKSIAEFGCGDSNQLELYHFSNYLGIDVSETAIEKCTAKFKEDGSKRFILLSELSGIEADLTLSIDVIFHLVEDEIFDAHLDLLFNSTTRFVIIYSTNEDIYNPIAPHVKHRFLTKIIEERYPQFQLLRHIPNKYPHDPKNPQTSRADFFIYKLKG